MNGAPPAMDSVLRELFRVETAERLQLLDHGLLRLEKSPGDKALLEEAFREAHSLKGAARMLGLATMQAVAHRLEDGLNSARNGGGLQPESIARLSEDLVELRRLTDQVVGGLGLAAPAPRPSHSTEPAATPVATPPGPAPEPAPAVLADRFRIDAVRVDTAQLDKLMTHAGELAVTRTRVARRLADIESIIEAGEELAARTSNGAVAELMRRLLELRVGHAEDSARLEYVSGEIQDGVRIARLLPLSTVFSLFPRPVRDLALDQSKEVEFSTEGAETSADKRILEEIKDPVMHLLRNAIHHGIESPAERVASGKPPAGRLRIRASREAGTIVVEVSDDGRGLDDAGIRSTASRRGFATDDALAAMTPAQLHSLIFASGFSTASFVTDVAGRGVGLDVVRANVERLKGTVAVHSAPGRGTRFVLRLPTTLATVRVLVVEVNERPYGVPADAVEESRSIGATDLIQVNGRDAVLHRGHPVPVARLSTLLELPDGAGRRAAANASTPCVFLTVGEQTLGLFVDALLDEQEVVLKAACGLLKRVRNVAGATILDSGALCIVLNADDLLASARHLGRNVLARQPATATKRRRAVLLAEDSIIIRTQEARILEGAGYEVVPAVDGLDAWTKLAARTFDAVVTDVNMPNLDGLGLVAKIRGERKLAELPVILVTSLASDADRKRGLEAGANAYITKPEFDQQVLLDCLERLV